MLGWCCCRAGSAAATQALMSILSNFSGEDFANPGSLVGATAYAIAFAAMAWLGSRIVRLAAERALARDTRAHLDRTAVRFLAQLARIGIFIFAFISYAHLVPALARLGTAWLASVSVISIVVGLAAQNTLGNLVAGVSLLLYRPFNASDRVQLMAPTGLETGTIEAVTLGYTVLRTDDNRRVVVPNSIMASQTMINLSSGDPRQLCSIPITIAHDADLDRARAILLELARGSAKAREVCDCPVTKLDGFGVGLTLNAWCADSVAAGAFKNEMLEQIKRRFAAENIRMPVIEASFRSVPGARG